MQQIARTNRRERRVWRLQKLVSDRDAQLVARLAGLDYRVSGESGALRVYTHSLSWHRAKCPNASRPPSGQGWDRSGPARLVGVHEANSPKRVIHYQGGRQVAAAVSVSTTE